MLVTAFKNSIFPYMVQVGAVMFVFSVCQLSYALFRRPDWQQFLDKFKASIFAYAVVKGAFTILAFVDTMIDGMH